MRIACELASLVSFGERLDLMAISFFVVFENREKELPPIVPEQFFHFAFEVCRFLLELQLHVTLTGESCNLSNGDRISPHVGIERGTITRCPSQDVLCLAAIDVEFHPVVVASLPEQANLFHVMTFFPALVVLDQIRQQVDQKLVVLMHRTKSHYGISQPCTIVSRLSTRRAEPVTRIVAPDLRLP